MAPSNNRLMISMMSKAHVFWYRLTGGTFGSTVGRAPVLLLTTTGRRSGRARTTPLLYLEDGGNLVVVASNADDDRDPGWWRNLKRHREGTVQIKRETRSVRADQASAEEKARLWPALTAMYPDYDAYTRRTTRDLPVVILRPQ